MDKVQNFARFATNSLSCCEAEVRLTFPLYIVRKHSTLSDKSRPASKAYH